MLFEKLIYFWNCHNSNNPPSTIYKIGPVFIHRYSPNVQKCGLELMFENGLFWFEYFIKKQTFWYKKEKTTKPGVLKRIVLNFGSIYISFFTNKEHLKLYMDRLQPYLIPENYFELKVEKGGKTTWYILYQNMIRRHRSTEIEKLYRISRLKEWNKKPSKKELRWEMMLNDWTRWNTELNKGEITEVSEYVYDEMLNCLPPKNWKGKYFEVGEPKHHEGGRAIHRAFIEINGKYYSGHPDTIQDLQYKPELLKQAI